MTAMNTVYVDSPFSIPPEMLFGFVLHVMLFGAFILVMSPFFLVLLTRAIAVKFISCLVLNHLYFGHYV